MSTNRRVLCALLAALIALSFAGCAPKRYQTQYYEYFDTVCTLTAYCDSQQEYGRLEACVRAGLKKYSELFDIYTDYADISNLKTVNDAAGVAPVTVDPAVIGLLTFSAQYAPITHNAFDPSLGQVLKLWHDCREAALSDPENARLPDMDALREAKLLVGMSRVEIDADTSAVFLPEAGMRLDVGAIGKGYAAKLICDEALGLGFGDFLLSLGGSVCAVGNKRGKPWVVGIEDPLGNQAYVRTLALENSFVATSGINQRYYTVDGVQYHHIIDPETLMPARYFASVSVVTAEPATADMLSTALSCMDYDDGVALLKEFPGTSAVWVGLDGQVLEYNGADK